MILALAANMMNLSHIGTWGGFGGTPRHQRLHLSVLRLPVLAPKGTLIQTILSL